MFSREIWSRVSASFLTRALKQWSHESSAWSRVSASFLTRALKQWSRLQMNSAGSQWSHESSEAVVSASDELGRVAVV